MLMCDYWVCGTCGKGSLVQMHLKILYIPQAMQKAMQYIRVILQPDRFLPVSIYWQCDSAFMKPSFQFNHPNSNPHVQTSPHQQPSEVQGHYKSQPRLVGSRVLSPSLLPQLCSSTDISRWERPQHPLCGRLCWLMVSHKYVTIVTHSSYWPKPNSIEATHSGRLCWLMVHHTYVTTVMHSSCWPS